MGYLSTDKKKITTKTYAEMKAAGEKVTMLTAYDFTNIRTHSRVRPGTGQ